MFEVNIKNLIEPELKNIYKSKAKGILHILNNFIVIDRDVITVSNDKETVEYYVRKFREPIAVNGKYIDLDIASVFKGKDTDNSTDYYLVNGKWINYKNLVKIFK